MTSTGSCSAIPDRTSTGSVPPDRSTRPSTSRPASSSTHGRSRSTCPRANAVLISRRSRVWSGGSISRIALRWIRLKLPEPLGRLLVAPDPAQPAVAEDGVGLGVRERQPQLQALVPLHRGDGPGPGERRVRVGDDRGVGQVERIAREPRQAGHAPDSPRPRSEYANSWPSPADDHEFADWTAGGWPDGRSAVPPTLLAWPPASVRPPRPPLRRASTRRRRARAAPVAATSTATARVTRRRSPGPSRGCRARPTGSRCASWSRRPPRRSGRRTAAR